MSSQNHTMKKPGAVFYEHTHPPGGLPNYYRENVIGGPGAFVLQIVNFDTFAEAMTNKLLTEVSQHKIQAHDPWLHARTNDVTRKRPPKIGLAR